MYAATKEDIKNDVKTGANRVVNDVRQTVKNVRDDLNQANLESRVEAFGQKVSDYADNAISEVYDASDRVTAYVRREPIQSLAIAAAVGALFGLALRR